MPPKKKGQKNAKRKPDSPSNVIQQLSNDDDLSQHADEEEEGEADSDSVFVAAQQQSDSDSGDDDDNAEDPEIDASSDEDGDAEEEEEEEEEKEEDAGGSDDGDDSDEDDGGEAEDVIVDFTETSKKGSNVSASAVVGGGDNDDDDADDGDDGGIELDAAAAAAAAADPSSTGVSKEERRAAKRSARELARYKRFGDKLAARGVVYLARVPPFMKPEKVKILIERSVPESEVTRLYLVPEDSALARRRKKLGGQRGTNYTEGWIEFATRRQARRCEAMLHMRRIGGKKRSHYRDDTWTLKYLKHFTWSHLTEKKAYERRVREHKLRLEMVAAKKQNEEFRGLVDQHKSHQAMAERRKLAAKGDNPGGGGSVHKQKNWSGDLKGLSGGGGGGGGKSSSEFDKIKRRFHQHKPLTLDGTSAPASSGGSSSTLGGGVGLSSSLLGATLGRSGPPQKKRRHA